MKSLNFLKKLSVYLPRNRKSGYSIIELMVSMSIFGFTMIVFTQVMFTAMKFSFENYKRAQFREATSQTLDLIKRDIRNANTISECDNTKCSIVIGTEYVWDICSDDLDSVCKYRKNGANLELIKKTPDNIKVESFDFDVVQTFIDNSEFSNITVIVTLESYFKSDAESNEVELLDIQQTLVTTRNAR